MDIVETLRGFEADHEPDGWPAVKMRQISELCDEAERMTEALRIASAALEPLLAAGKEAADVLRNEAAILRDCHTIGGKWDEEDRETRAHYDQMLALAERLTPPCLPPN